VAARRISLRLTYLILPFSGQRERETAGRPTCPSACKGGLHADHSLAPTALQRELEPEIVGGTGYLDYRNGGMWVPAEAVIG